MIVSHRDYPNPHSVISTVQKKDLLSIKMLKNITTASNFRKIPYQLKKEGIVDNKDESCTQKQTSAVFAYHQSFVFSKE